MRSPYPAHYRSETSLGCEIWSKATWIPPPSAGGWPSPHPKSLPLRAAALDQGSSASLRLSAILRLRFHADGRAVGIPNRGRSRYENAEQFRRSAHVRPDIRAPWLRLEVAVALQKTRRPSRGD